jgi:hypothetical protein
MGAKNRFDETVVEPSAKGDTSGKEGTMGGLNDGVGSMIRWADVVLNPTPTALPGSGTLQQMANGIAGWGLILALIAVVVGAVTWALASHSQNVHHAMTGRRTVLVAGGAALLIGAAPILINFFFSAGTGLH